MASKGIVEGYGKDKDLSVFDNVKEALKKTGGGLESVREAIKQTSNHKKIEDLPAEKELDCQKQLEEKDKRIEELTDTLKRLQAEFENFKKRIEKEKIEFVKYAHADVIANLLPVLDSFEIALKNTSDKEKFAEGIKMIYAQLYSALETEGLMPIKASGEKFDPYRHEVLMKEESDKPEDTILEEFQKGYMLNDKVLRHSKVKVASENRSIMECE